MAEPTHVSYAVIIRPPLVSLETAKAHLGVFDTDHDLDIDQKRTAASDAILMRLKHAADPLWTDVTVPSPVQQAILLLLTHYYEHRGDDLAAEDEATHAGIGRLLAQFLYPSLA